MLLAIVAALLLAFGLVACGDDDDSGSAATETSQAQSGQAGGDDSPDDKEKGEDRRGKSGGADDTPPDDSSAGFVPEQHNDSGGGSEQFRVKGGDNSVQEFGEEASDEEFEEAAAALHNFLDARAQGAWAVACEYMASNIVDSLQQLAARADSVDATSCAQILGGLTNPAAKGLLLKEARAADVGSLRTEGERAFVIYRGLEGTIYAMAMTQEDGGWKVASLAGTPLN